MNAKNWPVQDAKARFSELLDACVRDGPQVDAACFRRWAKLMHRQSGTVSEDAMIAATALVHELIVVTRNVRDFARFDVPVLNPFEQ